jgi:hypothetical protein
MKLFRFSSLLLVGVALIFFGVKPAFADGVVNWEGNGSENLPCKYGGYWVLAPAFGIESPTILTVNDVDYVMSQNGEGSWWADSSGPLDAGLVAYVSYTGEGDSGNHLQLSHCTEGESTPTPTTPPTPTETPTTPPTPTETPPGPTPTPTETSTPGPSPTPTKPVPTSTPTEPNTGGGGVSYPNLLLAFAGIAIIALALILPSKIKVKN